MKARWLIGGVAVLLLALWLGERNIHGSHEDANSAALSRSKTSVSSPESSARSKAERTAHTQNPIDAYLGQAKRGMTDQDVRTILDEFQHSGLLDMSPSEDRLHRRHAWYANALSEGLGLTSEQKEEVLESLARLDTYQPPQSPSSEGVFVVQTTNPYLTPWKLCRLTKSQTLLTLEDVERTQPGMLFTFSRLEIDPQTGEKINLGISCHQGAHTLLVSSVFPYTPDQRPYVGQPNVDLLTQTRHLHPAQLRMSLFAKPDLAQVLQEQLDSPKPQVENSTGVPSE